MNLLNSATGGAQSLSEAVGNPSRLPAQRVEGDLSRAIERDLFRLQGSYRMETVIKSNDQFDQATVHQGDGVIGLFIHAALDCGKSTLLKHLMGLSETLKDRGGISAYLPQLNAADTLVPQRPTLYYRNGILVGHTGRRITPEDVDNALAEE